MRLDKHAYCLEPTAGMARAVNNAHRPSRINRVGVEFASRPSLRGSAFHDVIPLKCARA